LAKLRELLTQREPAAGPPGLSPRLIVPMSFTSLNIVRFAPLADTTLSTIAAV
jgi:hypothetical protein